MLALSETKVEGKGECIFGSVVRRVSAIENGYTIEGVTFLVSKRVLEVSARLMWEKVKFVGEIFFHEVRGVREVRMRWRLF
mgnify:CR=1 FL=1